jgi:hypothetical protein
MKSVHKTVFHRNKAEKIKKIKKNQVTEIKKNSSGRIIE